MSQMYTEIIDLFDVGPRYLVEKCIGRGTYGYVVQALDTNTDTKVTLTQVAIKRLNKLDGTLDIKRFIREIRTLRSLRLENVLSLKHLLHKKTTDSEIGDIYLVTDIMDTDLNSIIKTEQVLVDDQIQYILYHTLRGLKYIHSANIIHRDLKPSNILVNADCSVKICDFGLSRPIFEGMEDLTEYVVTRYYRAPEIMLASHQYTKAVDIWSVGCTFGQMLAGRVLFPGQNYVKMIEYINRSLGTPSEEDIEFISNKHAKTYIKELKWYPKTSMRKLIGKDANPLALNLLSKMLEFNPLKRISVVEALKHPYFQDLHDSEDEPEFTDELDFKYEEEEVSAEDLKGILIEEIRLCEQLG